MHDLRKLTKNGLINRMYELANTMYEYVGGSDAPWVAWPNDEQTIAAAQNAGSLYTTTRHLLASLGPPPHLLNALLADECRHDLFRNLDAEEDMLQSTNTDIYSFAAPCDGNTVDDDLVACTTTVTTTPKHASVLPPCRICGEKASGFHYGANTCEACKGFFRRSLRKMGLYKCAHSGNCDVSAASRGQCGSCRYQKCLAVGMSKQAIKTGRYTHEKKSKDMEEVRQMMMKNMVPSSLEVEERLLGVIHSISSTHRYYSVTCVGNIPEREEEHLKIHAIQEQVFGSLKPIPLEEYLKIYHMTGIDVDGRREMLEGFVPLVEHNIRKLVAVAKAVPGFNNLPVEDQINIIKTSRFEVWMILHHRQFNPERNLFTTIHGTVVCKEDMLKVHEREYIDSLMAAQQRIRTLELEYEEMCTLAALAMMFTVESMQDLLLRCLIFWLKKYSNDSESTVMLRLSRLVNVLIQLRSVKHLHDSEEDKLIRLWFDKVHVSPLIYEMWVL